MTENRRFFQIIQELQSNSKSQIPQKVLIGLAARRYSLEVRHGEKFEWYA